MVNLKVLAFKNPLNAFSTWTKNAVKLVSYYLTINFYRHIFSTHSQYPVKNSYTQSGFRLQENTQPELHGRPLRLNLEDGGIRAVFPGNLGFNQIMNRMFQGNDPFFEELHRFRENEERGGLRFLPIGGQAINTLINHELLDHNQYFREGFGHYGAGAGSITVQFVRFIHALSQKPEMSQKIKKVSALALKIIEACQKKSDWKEEEDHLDPDPSEKEKIKKMFSGFLSVELLENHFESSYQFYELIQTKNKMFNQGLISFLEKMASKDVSVANVDLLVTNLLKFNSLEEAKDWAGDNLYAKAKLILFVKLNTALNFPVEDFNKLSNASGQGLLDLIDEKFISLIESNNDLNFLELLAKISQSHFLSRDQYFLILLKNWADLTGSQKNNTLLSNFPLYRDFHARNKGPEKNQQKLSYYHGLINQFTGEKKNEKKLVQLLSFLTTLFTISNAPPEHHYQGSIDQVIGYLHDELLQKFSEKYQIPKSLIDESKLSFETKNELLIYFSYLAAAVKSEKEKTFLKYIVICELKNITTQIKKGYIDFEILNQFFDENQKKYFEKLSFSHFPLIGNASKMEHWLGEGHAQYHINQSSSTPREEIDQITTNLNDALNHLSTRFKDHWQNQGIEIEIVQNLQMITEWAQFLSRAIKQKDELSLLKFLSEVPMEFIGNSPEETFQNISNEQIQLSAISLIIKIKDQIVQMQKELHEIEISIQAIQSYTALLDLIDYEFPKSYGIYLWQTEMDLLSAKLNDPRIQAQIKGQESAKAYGEFLEKLSFFKAQILHFEGHMDLLKNRIEKIKKQLNSLGETEAANHFENINKSIEYSKSNYSERVTIKDVTSLLETLRVLKEDNHCLSPDSSLNGSTNLSFLDPNRKLLVIRNQDGKLVANMLLTLANQEYINAQGHRVVSPVLLLDNIYSLKDPKIYYESIIDYLKKRFAALEIPLLAYQDMKGKKTIESEVTFKERQILLPDPQHGDAYHESLGINGRYNAKSLRLSFLEPSDQHRLTLYYPTPPNKQKNK